MEAIDCAVIGAGVVGLALARALALAGREVLVIEREGAIGQGNSSRNSEVIHSGLYYPPGSLKARLCVEGRQRLYAYAKDRGIAHRRSGKLIVASDESQNGKIQSIMANAQACGVTDLELLSREQALALEPALTCSAAVLSPSTGIIDSHALMTALLADVEDAGSGLVLKTKVSGGKVGVSRHELTTVDSSGESYTFAVRSIVNCAGLYAPGIAAALEGFPFDLVPRQRLARGCYFSMSGKAPFQRLIYPVPVEGGLGVHLTLDLAGQARFGPDIEWIDTIDYGVDAKRAESFYAEIRRYWPELADGSLQPAYSGIRPKLSGPGEPAADFLIQGPREHGIPGLVNLFGIESPGLTSSLAIGDRVAALLA